MKVTGEFQFSIDNESGHKSDYAKVLTVEFNPEWMELKISNGKIIIKSWK